MHADTSFVQKKRVGRWENWGLMSWSREKNEGRKDEMGDVEPIPLEVILLQTDSMNALGNDPLILSQHLAWCTHTLSPRDKC